MLKKSGKINCGFILAMLALVGCSSQVPLTKALIKEYNISNSDVKRLQLYVSDDILLEQEVTTIAKDVDSTHSLKKVEDRYIKQIVFKKKTPCIATSVESNRMHVAFEPGGQLLFESNSGNPDGAVFCLLPERKPGKVEEEVKPSTGYVNWNLIGHMEYADSAYNVFVRNHIPYLLVDYASLKTLVIDAREVKGMRQTDIK
jgi:hypothetical protein